MATRYEDDYSPLIDDTQHKTWTCEHCQQENSELDAECQYCDGDGVVAVLS